MKNEKLSIIVSEIDVLIEESHRCVLFVLLADLEKISGNIDSILLSNHFGSPKTLEEIGIFFDETADLFSGFALLAKSINSLSRQLRKIADL